MSRTIRYCNKYNKRLVKYFHRYKFRRSYCRCDYCFDDQMSRHRREKFKLEVKREMLNRHIDIYNRELSACVYICEPWKWCALEDGSCSIGTHNPVISLKKLYTVR